MDDELFRKLHDRIDERSEAEPCKSFLATATLIAASDIGETADDGQCAAWSAYKKYGCTGRGLTCGEGGCLPGCACTHNQYEVRLHQL